MLATFRNIMLATFRDLCVKARFERCLGIQVTTTSTYASASITMIASEILPLEIAFDM